MLKLFQILFTGVVMSLFVFPFNLPIQMEVNTKMVIALIGLILFGLDKSRQRELSVSKDFLILCVIGVLVSVWAFSVTVMNRTGDMSFATYIISILVWLGAAYAVTRLISFTHERLSIALIGNYLIAVAVGQCILAYAMTLIPSLKAFVDSLMGSSDMFMGVAEGRIYGLGAALDPAGLRFAAILVIISHLICQTDFSTKTWKGILYICSFAVIAVLGNMIARTTTVGVALALVYFIIYPLIVKKLPDAGAFWAVALPMLLVFVGIGIFLYNTYLQFRQDLRFCFEGFFSLIEKGRWEVRSNNILQGMIVWPESLRTWVIGDGFFDNPMDMPNIFGRTENGFYMQTDIGYLRYIFYFGVIGLLGMIAVAVQMTVTCCKYAPKQTLLFVFLLLVTLIGWLKVSSDIIMIFAPFLIMAYIGDPEKQASIECESSIA